MKVSTLLEKGTGPLNEDFCFTGKDLYGVFDGATSLIGDRFQGGLTGGRLASSIAGNIFLRNNASLDQLTDKANKAIGQAMAANGVNLKDRKTLWSTSAAVVRVAENRFEWTQIGDCLVMAIYEDDTHEILTDNFEHDLETLQMWKKVADRTDDSIMTALKGQIAKVREQMNVSYGVLNGETEALEFVNSGSRPLDGIKHLLIFTDGLFLPAEKPEKRDDFTRFAELFLQGGLTCVRDVVRQMESEDMTCRKYPRFKPHDDIAAVSLSF